MDLTLRRQFPVLERVAYLNAGTDGPVPQPARSTRRERSLRAPARAGPLAASATSSGLRELHRPPLRGAHRRLLGCDAGEVALTGSTTDGVNTVLAGLDLRPGDEIADERRGAPRRCSRRWPAARERRGVAIRVVPFARPADAVGPRHAAGRLLARVVDHRPGGGPARARRAPALRVLLDGAQGLGAVPVDVRALGCDFYAASGQKWLCGPDGTGYLYVREERIGGAARPPGPATSTSRTRTTRSSCASTDDARRFDLGFRRRAPAAWSLASHRGARATPGSSGCRTAAGARRRWLAARLADAACTVAPRGRLDARLLASDPDPEARVARCAGSGVVLRDLPGTPYVRASVGALDDEDELERLVARSR